MLDGSSLVSPQQRVSRLRLDESFLQGCCESAESRTCGYSENQKRSQEFTVFIDTSQTMLQRKQNDLRRFVIGGFRSGSRSSVNRDRCVTAPLPFPGEKICLFFLVFFLLFPLFTSQHINLIDLFKDLLKDLPVRLYSFNAY
jgi:hypothetical protein